MSVIRKGNPNRILCHHSAVSPGADNLDDLKKRLASYEIHHSKKSWAEETKTGGEYGYYYLAYHIAIAKDGHELRTQDDKYVLYHAGDNARGKDSFNLHGIGVLIDGNYETEIPTSHQKEALARIIARFERKYKVNVLVRGHKETSLTGTACPGKNIGTHDQGFMKEAIERANEIIKNNETDEPLNASPAAPGNSLEEIKKELEELRVRVGQLEATIIEKDAQISQLTADGKNWQKEAKSASDVFVKEREKNGKIITELESCQKELETANLENKKLEAESNNLKTIPLKKLWLLCLSRSIRRFTGRVS